MAKIPTKKVKDQVRVCHTFTFWCNLAEQIEIWQILTSTFTFLVGLFAIFGGLSNFSLLGGTSSILRIFLGGTSQKRHPVDSCIIGVDGQLCVGHTARPERPKGGKDEVKRPEGPPIRSRGQEGPLDFQYFETS